MEGRRLPAQQPPVGLSKWVLTNTPEYGNYSYQDRNYGTVAILGGHVLEVRNAGKDSRLGSYQDLAVTLKDVPAPPLIFSRLELLEGSAGIITRLENKVAGLPAYAAELEHVIVEKTAVLADVDAQLGKPFKHEDKLHLARAACVELEGKLKASIEPPGRAQTDPPVPEANAERHAGSLEGPHPGRGHEPSQQAQQVTEQVGRLLQELKELAKIQEQDSPAPEPFQADPVHIRGPRL